MCVCRRVFEGREGKPAALIALFPLSPSRRRLLIEGRRFQERVSVCMREKAHEAVRREESGVRSPEYESRLRRRRRKSEGR